MVGQAVEQPVRHLLHAPQRDPLDEALGRAGAHDDGGGELHLRPVTVVVGPRPPQRLIERIAQRRMEKVSDGLLDGLAAHIARVGGHP